MIQIAEKYKSILQNVEPYILSYPGNWDSFQFSVWGTEILSKNSYSCLSYKNAPFFEMLHKLDGISFGPMGMPMDKWVFFDCGEMPGAIVGFGVRASQLSSKSLSAFGIGSEYKGLIPISMYIAIPMVARRRVHSSPSISEQGGETLWFGHNLSSAQRVLEFQDPHLNFSGLGLLTKAYGISVMNIKTLLGATQWGSQSLHIHLQLADMELESAYTPAHTYPLTMTYRSHYSKETLEKALNGVARYSTTWDELLPANDEKSPLILQEKIETGKHFYKLIGRPVLRDGQLFYPAEHRYEQ